MIFVDRSIPKSVAAALNLVRGDVEWLEPRFAHNTPDATWLAEAGENGWLVIIRDKKVRSRPGERAAIKNHNVGCFMIRVKRNLTRWEYLKLLARHLDEMEDVFNNTPRPFIIGVDSGGVGKNLL